MKCSVFRADRIGFARRAEAGDRSARFSRMMLPHRDAAYTLARYLTRDPVAAEDIVQDAFLRAYRGFDSWRGDGAKAWLLTIVRNCFLNSVAAAGRISTSDVDDWAGELPPALIDNDSPYLLLSGKIEAEIVRAAVEQLPPPYRETLILRELEELSYKEIAEITQAPIGTVMSRLSRARQMLADRLLPQLARDHDERPLILDACPA
jgi:RNA polymerase sigma factor (sigma-70 family)